MRKILACGAVFALATAAPNAAFAYIGPGAGLGMIGGAIAVVVALIVAAVGLVLFPARLLLKRLRRGQASKLHTGGVDGRDPERG